MRIAIVGCGKICGAHIRAIKKIDNISELYLCDIDRSRAESIAETESVTSIYSDYNELLVTEKPESVHILTSPSSHAQIAEEALKSGSHVLLEKPPTDTTEELRNLFSLARANDKILCVDHSILGMPVVLKVKAEIASGSLGRLISAHLHFAVSEKAYMIPYADPNHWAYRNFGGVLANWATHPASLLLDLMDTIDEHRISFRHRNILPKGCADLLHVALTSKDQIGSLTLSMGHGSNERQGTLLFENGAIFIDITRQLYTCIKGQGRENFLKKAVSGFFMGYSPIKNTLKNISQALRGKLTRDPGIMNVIGSFYSAINFGGTLLVSEQNAIGVTGLLEKVWMEIDYGIESDSVAQSKHKPEVSAFVSGR